MGCQLSPAHFFKRGQNDLEHIDGNPREALVDSADPSVVSNELKAPTILDRWLGITGGREQRSEQMEKKAKVHGKLHVFWAYGTAKYGNTKKCTILYNHKHVYFVCISQGREAGWRDSMVSIINSWVLTSENEPSLVLSLKKKNIDNSSWKRPKNTPNYRTEQTVTTCSVLPVTN